MPDLRALMQARAEPPAVDAGPARVASALLAGSMGGSSGSRRRARFHALRVAEVRPLTADAIEVTFAVPEELAGDYDYLAGQYVALRATVAGYELRRSYSLCRPPKPGAISVAIKRDSGGRFSDWAQTELQVGDLVDVLSPQGAFTTDLAVLDGVHVAAIAAGSGITPVIALAATVLARSATSRFTLVYTNRSTNDVMFVDELADLKDAYPSRFALHHVLSREQRVAPVLTGRLDDERLRRIVGDLVLPDTVDEWFLCGPIDLVQRARDVLEQRGVTSDRVRFELFTAGERDRSDPPPLIVAAGADGDAAYALEFTLDGQQSRVISPRAARESLLTAALRARSDVPFACSGGVCGTCRARVTRGAVTMTENYALEPNEIERGFVLTCQSYPTSDEVTVDYDA